MAVNVHFKRLRLSGVGDHQTQDVSVPMIILVWDVVCVYSSRGDSAEEHKIGA